MTVSPSATDTPPAETAGHDGVPEALGCPACAHPMSAHDRIGLRFCRATTAGGADRGCVCSTA